MTAIYWVGIYNVQRDIPYVGTFCQKWGGGGGGKSGCACSALHPQLTFTSHFTFETILPGLGP